MSDSEQKLKMEVPKGVDMQSAHAGTCFVSVGHCRLGSVLGSILGAFWEPRSPLWCKLGAQKHVEFSICFSLFSSVCVGGFDKVEKRGCDSLVRGPYVTS